MSSSAFSARPWQGPAVDALARTMLDPTVCPSCGTSLIGLRCSHCGVDLSGETGSRVWSLGHQAVLTLREREELLVGLRAEAAGARSAPAAPSRPTAPVAPSAPPAPARGLRVQSLLVGLGALLLAVAAVVFL